MSVQDTIENLSKFEKHNESTTTKTRDVIPAGKTVCRLIEYVELGKQPQRPYMGQIKKPTDTVRLVFELLGPKNIHEVTQEDGKVIRFADKIYLTLPKSMNTKSKFFKLFNKLKYGREDKTHTAQMLGEAFTVELVHKQGVSKTGTPVTWVNPVKDGEYTFGSPRLEDPISGEIKELEVPPAIAPIRVFGWLSPTKEDWASLYIEGTYQKDGKEVSKNFIQETILNAVNYQGSPLEELLTGSSDFTRAANALTGIV